MSEQTKAWTLFGVTKTLEVGFLVAWKGFDISAAGNVFLFWVWFVSIACLLAWHLTDPDANRAYSPSRSAMSVMSAFAITGVLAWFGYFGTAAFYIFGQLCAQEYEERRNKKVVDPDTPVGH